MAVFLLFFPSQLLESISHRPRCFLKLYFEPSHGCHLRRHLTKLIFKTFVNLNYSLKLLNTSKLGFLPKIQSDEALNKTRNKNSYLLIFSTQFFSFHTIICFEHNSPITSRMNGNLIKTFHLMAQVFPRKLNFIQFSPL